MHSVFWPNGCIVDIDDDVPLRDLWRAIVGVLVWEKGLDKEHQVVLWDTVGVGWTPMELVPDAGLARQTVTHLTQCPTTEKTP
jgi:hypothetical protein